MSNRRKYDKEFKDQVVILYLQSDKSQKQIADDFGVSESLVGKWLRIYKTQHPGAVCRKPNEDELGYLKKQLREVTMERDILKKAVAIFSSLKSRYSNLCINIKMNFLWKRWPKF